MCVHLNKEKQSRDADTNNKEERLTTNKLSCGSIHSIHESLVDVLVSFHMLQVILHVVGLVALCAEFTCCQCTKLNHFLTCTGITACEDRCTARWRTWTTTLRARCWLPGSPDNGRIATSRDTTLTGVIKAALLSKASGSGPRRARLEPQYFWPLLRSLNISGHNCRPACGAQRYATCRTRRAREARLPFLPNSSHLWLSRSRVRLTSTMLSLNWRDLIF